MPINLLRESLEVHCAKTGINVAAGDVKTVSWSNALPVGDNRDCPPAATSFPTTTTLSHRIPTLRLSSASIRSAPKPTTHLRRALLSAIIR